MSLRCACFLSRCVRAQRRRATSALSLLKWQHAAASFRHLSSDPPSDRLAELFVPLAVSAAKTVDDINVGEELGGRLQKKDLMRILQQFFQRQGVREAARVAGLEHRLFHQSYVSFRKFILDSEVLPTEMHIALSDILRGAGHIDDMFPFFLEHARRCFPHLDCMDDLRKISDLTTPANWYPDARAIERKFIFHAGPTNSGKTYEALQRYMTAKSGIYCGPLRLLAAEVYQKTIESGPPADLITGEERRFSSGDPNKPANHVACTVEMVPTNIRYEVAVLDEIQMIKDPIRGWAWTRALLGLAADEVHLCGEAAALSVVRDLLETTADELEVCRYKRLTSLKLLSQPLKTLKNVRAGDCIVCFNKNAIYAVSRQLEQLGHNCAIIYGGLPPGTKLAQARNFNDPEHDCSVLVATDAIGMGLNLSIKRIIFNSLIKPNVNEKGEKEMEPITTSQALQIAGRAGRFGTQYEEGEVTTFSEEDLPRLREIMSRGVPDVEQAGLHPTDEQIELFGFHLPNTTLSNLLDIFQSISRLTDELYFMCHLDDMKFIADMIQHVPLPLKVRYRFCCAPIGRRQPFVCSMMLKYARQFSRGVPMSFDWVCRNIGWPIAPPANLIELVHLEHVFDVLDLYLWLSYRFPEQFPDQHSVRDMQRELDAIIHEGVSRLTKLLSGTRTVSRSDVTRLKAVALETDGMERTRRDSERKPGRLGSRSAGAATQPGRRPAEDGTGTPIATSVFGSSETVSLGQEEKSTATPIPIAGRIKKPRKSADSGLVSDDDIETSFRARRSTYKHTSPPSSSISTDNTRKRRNRSPLLASEPLAQEAWRDESQGGSIAERLIASGALTPELLERLKRELGKDDPSQSD